METLRLETWDGPVSLFRDTTDDAWDAYCDTCGYPCVVSADLTRHVCPRSAAWKGFSCRTQGYDGKTIFKVGDLQDLLVPHPAHRFSSDDLPEGTDADLAARQFILYALAHGCECIEDVNGAVHYWHSPDWSGVGCWSAALRNFRREFWPQT